MQKPDPQPHHSTDNRSIRRQPMKRLLWAPPPVPGQLGLDFDFDKNDVPPAEDRANE